MNTTQFDKFLDAMAKVTAIQVQKDKLREMEHNNGPCCGNCQHWMKKSSCKLEAQGHKPSMNHAPCGDFSECSRAAEYRRECIEPARKKLAELEAT